MDELRWDGVESKIARIARQRMNPYTKVKSSTPLHQTMLDKSNRIGFNSAQNSRKESLGQGRKKQM